MIIRRAAVLLTVALLAGTTAGIAVPAQARTSDDTGCRLVAATKNGAPFDKSWVKFSEETCPLFYGTKTMDWSVWNGPAPGRDGAAPKGTTDELGAGSYNDTYTLKFDVGRYRPRITTTTGRDVSVTRERLANRHWLVTITAKPVLDTRGYCTDPYGKPVCEPRPKQQDEGILAGQISNLVDTGSHAERRAFDGMDYSTNVDQNFPPSVEKARGVKVIELELGNSKYLHRPRNAVFHGFARMVIPDALLREVYGVDPAKLTARSWHFQLTGRGQKTVRVTDLDGALQIDLTNVTFPDSRFRYFRLTLAKAG